MYDEGLIDDQEYRSLKVNLLQKIRKESAAQEAWSQLPSGTDVPTPPAIPDDGVQDEVVAEYAKVEQKVSAIATSLRRGRLGATAAAGGRSFVRPCVTNALVMLAAGGRSGAQCSGTAECDLCSLACSRQVYTAPRTRSHPKTRRHVRVRRAGCGHAVPRAWKPAPACSRLFHWRHCAMPRRRNYSGRPYALANRAWVGKRDSQQRHHAGPALFARRVGEVS